MFRQAFLAAPIMGDDCLIVSFIYTSTVLRMESRWTASDAAKERQFRRQEPCIVKWSCIVKMHPVIRSNCELASVRVAKGRACLNGHTKSMKQGLDRVVIEPIDETELAATSAQMYRVQPGVRFPQFQEF